MIIRTQKYVLLPVRRQSMTSYAQCMISLDNSQGDVYLDGFKAGVQGANMSGGLKFSRLPCPE